jgi:hypothetical protein
MRPQTQSAQGVPKVEIPNWGDEADTAQEFGLKLNW